MTEDEIIAYFLDRLGDIADLKDNIVVGPGDDAAIVGVPASHELVVTTDVLLEGVHFPMNTRTDCIGYRAIAVNLSDLAAMGAVAKYVTIALTVEEPNEVWLSNFAAGVRMCCERFDVMVVGGNLTKGPLSIAVTALGIVERGKRLLRSGAEEGDDVWVSGMLGAGSLALAKMKTQKYENPEGELHCLLANRENNEICRFLLPEPRLSLGHRLLDEATSAIDISDGLFEELSRLSHESTCGFRLNLENVPCWPGAELDNAMGADDSYELLFTAPPSRRDEILNIGVETDTRLSRIGVIAKADSLDATENDVELFKLRGYRHFE